jgi:hypothetical protein
VNAFLSNQSSNRRVAYHCVFCTETCEFDRSETSSLLVRTGLSEVSVVESIGMVKSCDDTECGSVALRQPITVSLEKERMRGREKERTEVAREPVLQTVKTLIFSPFSICPSLSNFSKIHSAPFFPIFSHRSLSSSNTPTATSITFCANS